MFGISTEIWKIVITAMQLPIIGLLIILSLQVYQSLRIRSFLFIFIAWLINGFYIFLQLLAFNSDFILSEDDLRPIVLVFDLLATIFFFFATNKVIKNASNGFRPLHDLHGFSKEKSWKTWLVLAITVFTFTKLIFWESLNSLGHLGLIQLFNLPLSLFSLYALISLAKYLKSLKQLGSSRELLYKAFLFYGYLQLLSSVKLQDTQEEFRLIVGFGLGFIFKSIILYGIHRIFVFTARSTHEAQIVNENLNKILGRTFHEITGPLKTIRNKLHEFFASEPVVFKLTSRTKEQLHVIDNNFNRLIAVVSASMQIYESGLGKGFEKELYEISYEVDLGPNNLNSIIEIAIISLKESMEDEEKITFQRDYGKNCNIICYPNEIAQIIYNVLRNSLDSYEGKPGKIAIKTKVFEKDDGNQRAKFVKAEFADQGQGIPAKIIDQIFKEGFSTKRRRGRGYGLHIAKQLCEKNQGLIDIQSPYDFSRFNSGATSGTHCTLIFPITH